MKWNGPSGNWNRPIPAFRIIFRAPVNYYVDGCTWGTCDFMTSSEFENCPPVEFEVLLTYNIKFIETDKSNRYRHDPVRLYLYRFIFVRDTCITELWCIKLGIEREELISYSFRALTILYIKGKTILNKCVGGIFLTAKNNEIVNTALGTLTLF